MRRIWPWAAPAPEDWEEWRRRREARQQLLAKVRKRRAATLRGAPCGRIEDDSQIGEAGRERGEGNESEHIS